MELVVDNVDYDQLTSDAEMQAAFILAIQQAIAADIFAATGIVIDPTTIVINLDPGSIAISVVIPLLDLGVDINAALAAMSNSSTLSTAIIANVVAIPGIANISSGNISSAGVVVAQHTPPVVNVTMDTFGYSGFNGDWITEGGVVVNVATGVATFNGVGKFPIISTNGVVNMMGLIAIASTSENITWAPQHDSSDEQWWYKLYSTSTTSSATSSDTSSTVASSVTTTSSTTPDPCLCLFEGSVLPSSFYEGTSYGSSTMIQQYGTSCDAWDSMPGTPWYGYCPTGADFCASDFNWCSAPWCYVASICDTKVQTSVFYPEELYYSYEACGAPNCYTTFDDNVCPYDPDGTCVADGVSLALTVDNVDHDALTSDSAMEAAFILAIQEAIAADILATLGITIDPTTIVVVLGAGSVTVAATIPLPSGTDLSAAQGSLGSSSSLTSGIVSSIAALPGISSVSSGSISSSGASVDVHQKPESNFTMFKTTEFDGDWLTSEGNTVEVVSGVATFGGIGKYPIISTNGVVTMMGLTPTASGINVTWQGDNTTVIWIRMSTTTTRTTTTNDDPCACKFEGGILPSVYYEGTLYSNLAMLQQYGTSCAAWDSMEGTPWYGFCPPGADFCSADFNWCLSPWCYVSVDCDTSVETSVFYPASLHYSYEACGSPNCYANFDTAGCPYDPQHDCVEDGARMATTVNNVDHGALMADNDLSSAFSLAMQQSISGYIQTKLLGQVVDPTSVSLLLGAGSVAVQATIPLPGVDPAFITLMHQDPALSAAIVSGVAAVPSISSASSGTISATSVDVSVHTKPTGTSFTLFRSSEYDGEWTTSAGQVLSIQNGVVSFDGKGNYPIISTNGVVTMMGFSPTASSANAVTWTGGNTTVSWLRVTSTTTATTFVVKYCMSEPLILNSDGDFASCVGQPEGYNCWPPNCRSGYTWIGNNNTCVDGTYVPEGSCFPEGLALAGANSTFQADHRRGGLGDAPQCEPRRPCELGSRQQQHDRAGHCSLSERAAAPHTPRSP
jgi:hypothetical protein